MKMRMILGRVFSYCLTAVTAALIAMTTAATAAADDQVYRHADEFVSGAFEGTPPAARALWVQPALREKLSREFGWQAGLRVRFWQDGNRTAWILDEIGKERPITAGVVVEDGAIDRVEVLVFRESRGWEIKFPFFTDQFTALTLSDRGALSHSIDGITGATLSVRAMKRMARVALKLHDETQQTTLARRP